MPKFPRSVRLAIVVLLCGASGCYSGLFVRDDKTSYVTPVRRMEALAALSEQASDKTPAEKQKIVADLTRQIRDEEDSILREQIVRTLAFYPSPTTSSVLQAALQDGEPLVRIAAIDSLVQQGGDNLVPLLAEALRSDTDDDVRLAATRELAKHEDPRSMSALAVALDDRNPALQFRAMESLRDTTGKDFGNDVVAWRNYLKGDTDQPERSIAERIRDYTPF